jgi:membrane protein
MTLRGPWRLITGTFNEWVNDNISSLAASLAFYTVVSLAPILMILVALIGVLYGEETARASILVRAHEFVGPGGSQIIETVLKDALENSRAATFFGLAGIFFGATAVFVNLQDAMNAIWGVAPKPGGLIWPFIKKRILSFLMVLGFGVVLLLSLLVSTGLAALLKYASNTLPMVGQGLAMVDFAVWLFVLTFCFAVIYKVLPDAKISWPDVWVGAVAAALLFIGGQLLIGVYLTRSTIGSAFGAAGSLVIFLLWIYYSAQVFLLCSEFTQVYARNRTRRIVPQENAVSVTKVTRIA